MQTYRISQKTLEDKIDSLSKQTGVRFVPNFCYGAYGVHILMPNGAGAVTTFIGLGTKKETFQELTTIQQYFGDNDKRFEQYLISSCTHRDSLNQDLGK